jgi:nitrogen fixation NifU-like protein
VPCRCTHSEGSGLARRHEITARGVNTVKLDDVYQELLLDHYKSPRCKGVLLNPDRVVDLHNPLCGDQISLNVKFSADTISEIAFTGHGCSISQATASMMAELLHGKSKNEARRLSKLFRQMIKSEITGAALDDLGDALALEGVKNHSARVKCALLAWDCVDRALSEQGAGSLRDEIPH